MSLAKDMMEAGAPVPASVRRIMRLSDAVATMTVCVIGGGLLTIPNFFLETGLLASTVFTLVLLTALHFSVDLLAAAAVETGQRSYEGIAYALFGGPGLWAVEICLFVLQFGTVCGYLVTMAALVEPLCGSRALALILSALLLGMLRDDNTLHGYVGWSRICVMLYASCLALLLAGAVWMPLPGPGLPLAPEKEASHVPLHHFVAPLGTNLVSVLRSLPVMFQAYTFQSSFFTMIDEMHEAGMATTVAVTKQALLLSSVLYSLVGMFGVLALGTQPDADILRAVTGGIWLYETLRMLVALMVALSFALVYIPCRRTLDRLLFFGYASSGSVGGVPIPTSSSPIPPHRLFVNSLLVLLVAVLMTLRVSSLQRVLTLTGSSAGIVVSLALPCIFFLKCSRVGDRRRAVAMLMLAASAFLFVVCFIAVITRPTEAAASSAAPALPLETVVSEALAQPTLAAEWAPTLH